MSRAAEGFQYLADEALKLNNQGKQPTWAKVAKILEEAAKIVADGEYADRMGDDM